MPDREAGFEVIGDRPTAGDRIALLRAAGFAEAGTVWEYGDDRILAGIR